MAVKVTCVEREIGFHEEPLIAISKIAWKNEDDNESGISTRLQIYEFLQRGGLVYIIDEDNTKLFLTTAETQEGIKYVRTLSDIFGFDPLLSVPNCSDFL